MACAQHASDQPDTTVDLNRKDKSEVYTLTPALRAAPLCVTAISRMLSYDKPNPGRNCRTITCHAAATFWKF